jgi:hypothetical protein
MGSSSPRYLFKKGFLKMSNLPWTKATGPSAGLVKQHFIKARQEELARRNPGLQHKVAEVLINHNSLKHLKLKMKGDKWSSALTKVYGRINKALQSRELTINFEADNWFTTENTYEGYAQMYERSMGPGGAKFLTGDIKNPANTRARVDDKVTLPASWQTQAAPAVRGLRPGVQRGQRLVNQMQFGKQGAVAGFEAKDKVESKNPYFNPKTKQVFAALNYGQRKHGSSMIYGDCQLILHDRFKANAFYYGRDTFTLEAWGKDTGAQCAYGMLAAVIADAHTDMQGDIIKSCYFGTVLGDNSEGSTAESYLLEAHLFEPLTFSGNIKAIKLASKYMGSRLITNAHKFATKHGAKLMYA